MVSQARLDWLSSLIHAGRRGSVAFSYNPATRKEKVKFVLDAIGVENHPTHRPCMFSAINAIAASLDAYSIADKGHSSTNGRCVIEFWIAQPASSDSDNINHPAGMRVPSRTTHTDQKDPANGDIQTEAASLHESFAADHVESAPAPEQCDDAIALAKKIEDQIAPCYNHTIQQCIELHSIITDTKTMLPETIYQKLLTRSAAMVGRSKQTSLESVARDPDTLAKFSELADMCTTLRADFRESCYNHCKEAPKTEGTRADAKRFEMSSPSKRGMPTPTKKSRRKR